MAHPRPPRAECARTPRRSGSDLALLLLPLLCCLCLLCVVCLSVPLSVRAASPPAVPVPLELGILNTFSGASALDGHQLGEAVAVIMAVRDINAQQNTVLNLTAELGKWVDLSVVFNDTQGDTHAAIVASLWQTARPSVLGIVGEAVSFLCVPVSAVAATGGGGPLSSPLASVSHSCTAPVLSDKLAHPTFMRLVPSDSAQGTLLARIIEKFQWQRIAVVATHEVYGASVAATMLAALDPAVRQQTRSYTVETEDAAPMREVLQQIKDSGTHVIVVAMVYWSATLFEEAASLGLLSDLYVWLCTDAVLARGVPAVREDLRNELRGVLGIVPLLQTALPPYQRFLESWYRQNVSDFPMLPPLPEDIFDSPPSSSYAAVAYDVIVAYALAAQLLLMDGVSLSRAAMLSSLHSPQLFFDGVSRSNIRFDDNSDLQAAYSVLNNQLAANSEDPSPDAGSDPLDPEQTPPPPQPPSTAVATFNLSMRTIAEATVGLDLTVAPQTMQQIATEVQFKDGTNSVPFDRDADLLLPLTLLITSPGATRPLLLPVTDDGADCVWLFDTSVPSPSGNANSTACFGGVSRRLAYFRRARAERSNVLAVDMGGAWFPSQFYTLDGGSTVAQWLSLLRYDALTLALQDFVIGAQAAENLALKLQPQCNATGGEGSAPGDNPNCILGTMLLGTVAQPKSPFNTPDLVHRVVLKRVGSKGRMVALLSLQRADLQYASSSSAELQLTDEQVTELQRQINWLNETHAVNVVVLISTSRFSPANVVSRLRGVSVLVTALPGATDKLLDAQGNPVLVVPTALSTDIHPAVVDVSLQIDEQGKVYLYTVRDEALGPGSESSADLDALISDAANQARDLATQTIGVMPDLLYGEPGRLVGGARGVIEATSNVSDIAMGATFVFQVEEDGCLVTQCSAGNMLADVMLQYCARCQIAHLPGDSIFGSLPQGNITRGMINALLPNNTELVSYELLGSRLLDTLLLYSIDNVGLGDYQQWSGLRFSYHADAHGVVGITSCTVREEDGTFRPLQPNGYYRIITTDRFFDKANGPLQPYAADVQRFQLQLSDWIQLQVSNGAFLNTPAILSRSDLGACWNTSFALQSDSMGGFLWPEARCRWLTSARQLCPSLEVPTSTALDGGIDPGCRCIASYTRSTVEVSGVRPCVHCPATQSKQFVGDHECVCDSSHYRIPDFFDGKPFRCIDPTGFTAYAPPDTTDALCRKCPVSCLGCAPYSNELNASSSSAGDWAQNFFVLPGWWWDGQSNEIYLCSEDPGNCKGTELSSSMCAVGQTGPLCQQCAEGFGGFTHGTCSPCSSQTYAVLLLVFTMLVVLAFLVFLLYSAFVPKQRSSDVVKILLRHVQMAAFVGALRVSDGGVLRAFSAALGLANTTGVKSLAYSCVGQLDAIQHIEISSVVLGALLLALAGALATREIRRRYFRTKNDDVQLKVVEPLTFLRTLFCCCLRDKTRYGVDGEELPEENSVQPIESRHASSSVADDVRALGLSHAPLRFKRWTYEQTLSPACVILLLFLYPALMVENLSFMRDCLRLGSRSYMADDTSIDCDSDRYKVWFYVALARIIVLGVGLPLAILLRIARFQYQLRVEEERSAAVHEPMRARGARSFFLRYRFLFEGYKENAWFWEVVTLVRHDLLIVILVFLSQEGTSQAAAAAILFIAALVLHMARRPYREDETDSKHMSARQRVLRSMRLEHEKAALRKKAMAAWNHADEGNGGLKQIEAAEEEEEEERTSGVRPCVAPLDTSPRAVMDTAKLASPSVLQSDADGEAATAAAPVAAADGAAAAVPSPVPSPTPSGKSGGRSGLSRFWRFRFPVLSLNMIELFSLTLLLVQVCLAQVTHTDPWLKAVDSSSQSDGDSTFAQQLSGGSVVGRRLSTEATVLQWLVILAHLLFVCYVIIKEWPILWKRTVRLIKRAVKTVTRQAAGTKDKGHKAINEERFRGVTVPESDVALAVLPSRPGGGGEIRSGVGSPSAAATSTAAESAVAGVRSARALSSASEAAITSAPIPASAAASAAVLRRRRSSSSSSSSGSLGGEQDADLQPPGRMDQDHDESRAHARSVSAIDVDGL